MQTRQEPRFPARYGDFADWLCGRPTRSSGGRAPTDLPFHPHRLGRIRLQPADALSANSGSAIAVSKMRLHRRIGFQVDLLRHCDGDMADHADIGQRRCIAMAEFARVLVPGQMSLQRGQRLHRPVPPPRRLLRVAQVRVRGRDSAAPAAPAADGPRRRPSAPARATRARPPISAGSSGGEGYFSSRCSRMARDWRQRGAVILDQRRQRHLLG